MTILSDNFTDVSLSDLRFTDLNGIWHHISICDSDNLTEEFRIDGSSIKGWKSAEDSDMILQIDKQSVFEDPFTSYTTNIYICNVVDPNTGLEYNRDPRSISQKAEQFLIDSNIADTCYFGPELEFFILSDVRYKSEDTGSMYQLDSEEFTSNTNRLYESNNLGNQIQKSSGYLPTAPVDSIQDIRFEMVNVMKSIGMDPILCHHEVAPAQHELAYKYSTLTESADNAQKYKYLVKQISNSYGKVATFMPKPIYNDNGNGMHVHQSLWRDGKNLFSDFNSNNEGNLSETALYYIGGILKHVKSLNAICNPSFNSYKRLVAGFEAPTVASYSARNRSVAIRIPYNTSENSIRIETRFPDPASNPYLCFAALLMAGIDGIKNKIHPGDATKENMFLLSKKEIKNIPSLSTSLEESLEYLRSDSEFLLQGDVFTTDVLEAFIELKEQEIDDIKHRPHPKEFDYYFNC